MSLELDPIEQLSRAGNFQKNEDAEELYKNRRQVIKLSMTRINL